MVRISAIPPAPRRPADPPFVHARSVTPEPAEIPPELDGPRNHGREIAGGDTV
jgi:hypothetical protein